jgi:hypothetical protein
MAGGSTQEVVMASHMAGASREELRSRARGGTSADASPPAAVVLPTPLPPRAAAAAAAAAPTTRCQR